MVNPAIEEQLIAEGSPEDRQEKTARVMSERRHTTRMPLDGLAYVNLARDNGGTILNVSEGGLCFQSRMPVHSVDTICFWFSYRCQRIELKAGRAWTNEPDRGVSRFIEVCSELAWIDETRKKGGLRFKKLPQAAREQIRDWMRELAIVPVNNTPSPQLSSVRRPYRSPARAGSARLEGLFRQIQAARLWTGFSGGVVSGVLLSAVLVGLFSFLIHTHKLGDSLIRLGELLGGRSWSQALSPALPANSQEPLSTSPKPQPIAAERKTVSAELQEVSAPIEAPLPEKFPSTSSPTEAKSSGVKLEVPGPGVPSVSRTVTRPGAPRTVVGPAAEPDKSMLWPRAPEIELVGRLGVPTPTDPSKVESTIMEPEKYLEVGKFKEKPLADTQVDNLARLDFPVEVIQSGRFFRKSYQVLVGPYKSDSEAEAVHKDLSSRGFTPRSYERGTRDFRLSSGLKIGTTYLPVGDCVIGWESYIPDAIVKIQPSRGASVTVEGKWVKHDVRYAEDAIVYEKARDGSLALVEIRFAGLREALVFGGRRSQ